jgi:dienelactone hydrolase
LERLRIADEVTFTDVRQPGLVGRLYEPEGHGPHPGIIVLGGSGGGLPGLTAGLIASHGFMTLALAYFGYEDLPEALNDIPLEYFETAIRWLQSRDSVRRTGIGLVGTSRGGELALLLGATYRAVRAVVGFVPSHVVWPGLGGRSNAPAWTHRGVPVPMMPSRSPGPAQRWTCQPRPLTRHLSSSLGSKIKPPRLRRPSQWSVSRVRFC